MSLEWLRTSDRLLVLPKSSLNLTVAFCAQRRQVTHGVRAAKSNRLGMVDFEPSVALGSLPPASLASIGVARSDLAGVLPVDRTFVRLPGRLTNDGANTNVCPRVVFRPARLRAETAIRRRSRVLHNVRCALSAVVLNRWLPGAVDAAGHTAEARRSSAPLSHVRPPADSTGLGALGPASSIAACVGTESFSFCQLAWLDWERLGAGSATDHERHGCNYNRVVAV